MSKRTLSFAGILIAFVFLLAINTNVFSVKKCDEINCGPFNECFYDSETQKPDDAKCDVIIPDILTACITDQQLKLCNFHDGEYCCKKIVKNCDVMEYEEGQEYHIQR